MNIVQHDCGKGPAEPGPSSATRAGILEAAAEACLVSRAETHGPVEDSFTQLAAVWSVRADRGAEERLGMDRQTTLVPIRSLKKDAHLEMHTRGG